MDRGGLKYRADVDGLRAFAILPVLFYHAGVSVFKGGFVGVDVFFVISGFLITGILNKDFEANRYSIRSFYERRIRRIIPPMIAVSAFSLIVAGVIYLPHDLEETARSAIVANLFVSNIHFYNTTDYFDAVSGANPFLHTWSLSVEEQFYIVFPGLLWLLHRFAPRFKIPVIALGWAASLAASVWAVDHLPTAAFYLAPFRAWELFSGSLLALGAAPQLGSRPVREALSVAGLGLIGLAIFTLDAKAPFPGLNALPPVIGSVLLIWTAPGTSVGRLLAFKPIVWVGLMSYSLYLWHWPIMVFPSYVMGEPLTGWATVLAIVASFAAAYVSWRFIERPFREPRRMSGATVFRAAGAGVAIVCAVGVAGLLTDGLRSRYAPQVLQMADAATDHSTRRLQCHRGLKHSVDPPLDHSCRYGASGPARFALWGDSHGVELAEAIGDVAARHGQSVLQLTYSSCPPIASDPEGTPGCRAFEDKVRLFLISQEDIRTVLIVADLDRPAWRRDARRRKAFTDTVNKLQQAGKQVVIAFPTPVQPGPVPRTIAVRSAVGLPTDSYGVSSAEFYRRNREVSAMLDAVSGPRVQLVRLDRLLCASQICATLHAGAPLYFDDNHLSQQGARFLAPLFEPIFSAGWTATAEKKIS